MDKAAIVRRMYQAYLHRDRDAIEAILSPDFHFTSPLDNRIDRDVYFDRCWPGGHDIEAFEFAHLIEFGDQVFVTYEALRKDGSRFRNTEIVTLRSDKAVQVEVYFGWSIPHKAKSGGFVDQ